MLVDINRNTGLEERLADSLSDLVLRANRTGAYLSILNQLGPIEYGRHTLDGEEIRVYCINVLNKDNDYVPAYLLSRHTNASTPFQSFFDRLTGKLGVGQPLALMVGDEIYEVEESLVGSLKILYQVGSKKLEFKHVENEAYRLILQGYKPDTISSL